MPRPRKWRKVCCLPESDQFGPLGKEQDNSMLIMMSVEEYESIRLIDLEGYTQEACAKQMDVARTTVQGIYADARKKLAESLVNGKTLRIVGGDYKICDGAGRECHGGGCRRHGEVREDD